MLKKLLITSLVILFFPMSLSANVDMFLKIEGVAGESQHVDHKDQIDILAWSWDSSSNGRVTCANYINFVKWTDLASPNLLMGQVEGTVYPNATFTVRTASADRSFPYIEISLKNVSLRNLSAGGSRGEDRLTETVAFSFEEATYTYTPRNNDGTLGNAVSATFFPSRCK